MKFPENVQPSWGRGQGAEHLSQFDFLSFLSDFPKLCRTGLGPAGLGLPAQIFGVWAQLSFVLLPLSWVWSWTGDFGAALELLGLDWSFFFPSKE